MEKTDFKTKSFYADPEELEKLEKQKKRQVLNMICGAVLIVVAIILIGTSDKMWYDKSGRDIYEMTKNIFIIAGVIELVVSPVLIYIYSKSERRLSQIYITVTDERIHGLCFDTSEFVGRTFSILYSDMIKVSLLYCDPSRGSYICIESTSGMYSCYDLENKTEAVRTINERMEEYKVQATSANNEFDEKSKEYTGTYDCYCIYCGTKLPKEAVFCPNCGKSQKQA